MDGLKGLHDHLVAARLDCEAEDALDSISFKALKLSAVDRVHLSQILSGYL